MKNLHNLTQLKNLTAQNGVVLIEALIALLIFSMGILALVGLQAAMLKNTSDSKYRADASFLAQESIGQGWANTSDALGSGNLANINCNLGDQCADVSNILPNGTREVSVAARGLVTVTVRWQVPGGDPHSYTTATYIGAL